ncbi:hypothetical protein H6G80_19255 [Nostoc sp. FACHB-87]|uniref:hypothetical protein n=1 Tax=Nostocaceae TaxID=1162 RepID=UPI0016823BAF|nr:MULTISPECIES: hypothetical protein [Nostocaceae]MBD2456202.1 hypothetical protein [Nostoc sp. FACHB-87]MBD2477622.1 hypothetical protein [Anabaena sp. FACHB-83]
MKSLLFPQLISLSLLVFTTLLTNCQVSQASQVSTLQASGVKESKIIGGAIDCDNDGRQNDSRIDDDGDGIPDRCEIGHSATAKQEIDTPKQLFEKLMQSLTEMTEGCEDKTKVKAGVVYRICTINNEPVTASEALLEVGDGVGFWFRNNKVIAIRYFHSGETLFFDDEQLIAKFSDDEKLQSEFSDEERREAENLAQSGYQNIFQVFTE